MLNYIKECLTSKYVDFKGRARRSEFWYFVLFYYILIIGLGFLGIAIGESNSGIFNIILLICYLGIILPYLSVACRRMHDVGKSGWFILVPIYNLILACTDSQIGENEYGPNPKGIGNNKNTDDLIKSIGNQQ